MTVESVLPQIYLDANATTPVLEQAADAALVTMKTMFGNPSSSHITGLQAKQLMEQTRQKARAVLGSGHGRVIFTSGATEGIQTGILSAFVKQKRRYSQTKNIHYFTGQLNTKQYQSHLNIGIKF